MREKSFEKKLERQSFFKAGDCKRKEGGQGEGGAGVKTGGGGQESDRERR